MNLLIKEEDTNPNRMRIRWKTMATIKIIAKAERASRLTMYRSLHTLDGITQD